MVGGVCVENGGYFFGQIRQQSGDAGHEQVVATFIVVLVNVVCIELAIAPAVVYLDVPVLQFWNTSAQEFSYNSVMWTYPFYLVAGVFYALPDFKYGAAPRLAVGKRIFFWHESYDFLSATHMFHNSYKVLTYMFL